MRDCQTLYGRFAATFDVFPELRCFLLSLYLAQPSSCRLCHQATRFFASCTVSRSLLITFALFDYCPVALFSLLGLRLFSSPSLSVFRQVKLTFPVIYVRGRRLNGGYEELERMSKDGSLVVLLRMTDSARTRVVPPKDLQLPSSSQKPQFLRTAGGSHWLRFQFYVYGNVLRGIALCQVIVFGIVLGLGGLDSDGKHALWLVLADAAAFVLIGPTPLSPFGCLATFLLWRRRGTVASAVPYKVTFTLYILLLAPSLVCGDSDNPVCDALSSDGVATTLLINSSLLTVFRF